jgi:hypothetical protein
MLARHFLATVSCLAAPKFSVMLKWHPRLHDVQERTQFISQTLCRYSNRKLHALDFIDASQHANKKY